MKFIMLINVKMPTIVGILTFIYVYKHETSSFVGILVFYEQLKFHAQLSLAWKKLYKLLGPVFFGHTEPLKIFFLRSS